MNAGLMDPWTTVLLIALMVASFYLLIIRPNNRRKAEQARLHEALKPGARVMLSSGIYGTVTEVGDRQAVVEVAPGVELTVLKQAVLQAVTPGSQFAEDTDGEHEAIDPAADSARTAVEPAADHPYAFDEPAGPASALGDFDSPSAPGRGAANPDQSGETSERDRGSWPSEGGEKR